MRNSGARHGLTPPEEPRPGGKAAAHDSPETTKPPRGLRWREHPGGAVLAPSWAYTMVGASILALQGTIVFAVLDPPPVGQTTTPWFLWLVGGLVVAFLGGVMSFPLWGGVHIELGGGRFRGGGADLPLAEISRFEAAPHEGGYEVWLVTATARIRLDLPFRNALLATAGNTEGARRRRRDDDRAQAEFIAAHLDALLLAARRGTSYRR